MQKHPDSMENQQILNDLVAQARCHIMREEGQGDVLITLPRAQREEEEDNMQEEPHVFLQMDDDEDLHDSLLPPADAVDYSLLPPADADDYEIDSDGRKRRRSLSFECA